MSGPIRSIAAPTLKRVRDYIDKMPVFQLANEDLALEQKILHYENFAANTVKLVRKLESACIQLSSLNTEWTNILSDLSGDAFTKEEVLYEKNAKDPHGIIQVMDRARETIEDLRCDIERANKKQDELKTPSPLSIPPTVDRRGGATAAYQAAARLPKVSLPEFGGDERDWPAFWATFEANVHSQPIAEVTKLTYLLSLLKDKAKATVQGYPVTPENYAHVVNRLKERFAHPDRLTSMLFSKLQMLPRAELKNVRSTLETMEGILRQLEYLKEDVSSGLFSNIIESKMPLQILDKISTIKRTDLPWSNQKLRLHLELIVSDHEQNRQLLDDMWGTKQNNPLRIKSMQKPQDGTPEQECISTLVASYRQVPQRSEKQISKARGPCVFCGEVHYYDSCKKYSTLHSRQSRADDLGLCHRCLRKGHQTKSCRTKIKPCFYCKQSHTSAMCSQKFCRSANSNTPQNAVGTYQAITQEEQIEATEPHALTATHAETLSTTTANGKVILLSKLCTVLNIEAPENAKDVVVFFDTGSHQSYVVQELADALKLPSSPAAPIQVSTFGSKKPATYETALVQLGIRLLNGGCKVINARAVPYITRKLPAIQVQKMESQNSSVLASENIEVRYGEPQLLIGMDCCFELWLSMRRLPSGFTLVDTLVGPILAGHGYMSGELAMVTHADTVISCLASDMETYWGLESLGIRDDPNVSEDDLAFQQFQNTIKRLPDGRYEVHWPWRTDSPNLAKNFGLSYGRLASVLKKLQTQPALLHQYNQTFKEQLELGIIERVSNYTEPAIVQYIPHQPVLTPNKTSTKLRIVFDASAKTAEGKSLNESLYKGPMLIENMAGILLRFRVGKDVLLGDIEKAFLQVSLADIDRDATRFLWVRRPEESLGQSNLAIFRFKRLPFGVISSPFLLSAVIQHHLKTYDTPLAKQVLSNIYVDNVVLTSNNPNESRAWYSSLKEMFRDAKMNVRQFATNAKTILETIPETDRLEDDKIAVLGVMWHTKTDKLSFKLRTWKEPKVTKRSVLAFMHSHFDPIGLLSPIMVPLKMMHRAFCLEKLEWDEEAGETLKNRWVKIMENWSDFEFSVPRCIFTTTEGIELHVFSDASKIAMATAVYGLKRVGCDTQVKLLFSKTHLMPIKSLTIPNAELVAAWMGARAVSFVREHLKIPETATQAWTDSKCVLYWLSKEGGEGLPRFVKNRVVKIQNLKINFRYVPTELNPADVGSRGLKPAELKENSLWWSGPSFLLQEKDTWPKNIAVKVAQEKEKQVTHVFTAPSQIEPKERTHGHLFDLAQIKRYNWAYLINTIARALYFLKKVEKKPVRLLEEISPKFWFKSINIEVAERLLLQQEQLAITKEELGKWDLHCHEDKLWRCHGRLKNSDLNNVAKYPIYLPRDSKAIEIMVMWWHEKLFHAGASRVLTEIRKRFWIPQFRSLAKKIINKNCYTCRKWDVGPFALPEMAPLPKERVRESRCFQHIGLDYMGPFNVRLEEKKVAKRWVLVITCLATRGIHLEVVHSLSTGDFIDAFKCFVARRGKPETIYSDNGTQFVAAANFVQAKWIFIAAHAPWRGGVYERMVGMVKNCFKKAIGKKLLLEVEFRSLITQIEGVINSRPLTQVAEDSLDIIRPIDFMVPNVDTTDDLELPSDEEEYLPKQNRIVEQIRTRLKKTQLTLDKFWQIWKTEYLNSLRERQQRFIKQQKNVVRRSPVVGEIVQLSQENQSRAKWKLARISEIKYSDDNTIRTAIVETANGHKHTRPISALYPLELNLEDQTEMANNKEGTEIGKVCNNVTLTGENIGKSVSKSWKYFLLLIFLTLSTFCVRVSEGNERMAVEFRNNSIKILFCNRQNFAVSLVREYKKKGSDKKNRRYPKFAVYKQRSILWSVCFRRRSHDRQVGEGDNVERQEHERPERQDEDHAARQEPRRVRSTIHRVPNRNEERPNNYQPYQYRRDYYPLPRYDRRQYRNNFQYTAGRRRNGQQINKKEKARRAYERRQVQKAKSDQNQVAQAQSPQQNQPTPQVTIYTTSTTPMPMSFSPPAPFGAMGLAQHPMGFSQYPLGFTQPPSFGSQSMCVTNCPWWPRI